MYNCSPWLAPISFWPYQLTYSPLLTSLLGFLLFHSPILGYFLKYSSHTVSYTGFFSLPFIFLLKCHFHWETYEHSDWCSTIPEYTHTSPIAYSIVLLNFIILYKTLKLCYMRSNLLLYFYFLDMKANSMKAGFWTSSSH